MAHTTPIPGDRAPALKLDVLGGDPIDLGAGSGTDLPENFSVVFFYRGVHCPICRTQLEELVAQKPSFEALGIAVHAVSMDCRERAERQKAEWAIGDLPIGYGMTEDTARAFGLFISAKEKDAEPERFNEPGIVIIYPDGTIYALYLQNVPFARPRIGDLRAGLKMAIERSFPVRGKVAA